MTEEIENTTTPEAVEQTQQPSFGLADLVFTLQIIEACTQRGAFKAEELSNVGAAYDRLKAFLAFNNAIPGAETNTAPVDEPAVGE
jgi:hypothetical protein